MLKLSLLVAALLMAATGLHLIGLPQDDLFVQNYIVWQLRIPRLLAGICVGGYPWVNGGRLSDSLQK